MELGVSSLPHMATSSMDPVNSGNLSKSNLFQTAPEPPPNQTWEIGLIHLSFKAPFVFFWAYGDAHQFSKSELFFGNLKGEIWKLPYNMEKESELPQQIK